MVILESTLVPFPWWQSYCNIRPSPPKTLGVTILQRPQAQPTATWPSVEPHTPERAHQGPSPPAVERFASPPITMRRSRACSSAPGSLTLGEFLAAATKHIVAALPTPGRKPRRPLNFTPRRGRSVPTAHRRDVRMSRSCAPWGSLGRIRRSPQSR